MTWLVDVPALPKNAAKILLNLTMIAADALVRGGRLDIAAEGAEIVVRSEGPRLVLDKEIRAVLAGEGDSAATVTSRTSAAWLTRRLAEEAHGTIGVVDQEDGVLLLAATIG
jgi:histidine phosphotransferase ChpT